MSSCRALGLDLGTTNTKAVLVEVGSTVRVLRSADRPTPAPADLGPALSALVADVLGDGPPPAALGIASMAETGVPLDRDGRPLGDWVRWDGHRPSTEAATLTERLGWDHLVAATGTRPSAKVPLATWAWLRRAEPDRFAAMTRWAGVADLAGLLLTGRLATDHTLAGRTMAYRLPADAAPAGDAPLPAGFDAALLAEVGLRPEMLPDVVTSGVSGTAHALLPAGTPVVIAGHDHAVGAYAAGVRAPGQVADSVGTAEAVLSVVDRIPDPLAVGRAGMSSVITVDGTARAVLAGSSTAGAVVSWWFEQVAADADRDALFAAALALGDDPAGPVVLPYLHGRQTPAPDPGAILRVVDRCPTTSPAQLARALLDGLCLHARWIVEEQHRVVGGTGAPHSVVALGNPLIANPAWLRVKALSLPAPLRLVTEPEAVAAGAALVAAVRAGRADPVALSSRTVAPGSAPSYDQALAAFIAAATENRGDRQ